MTIRLSFAALLVALIVIGGARLSPATSVHAASEIIHGLTSDNQIVTFTKSTPGTITETMPITGLQPGERLFGIDVRPATNEIYGLGDGSRLYRIDASTGVATAVGPAFTPPLEGGTFGFDFNPVVDRIRIVSDSGQNLRAHPDTGEVVEVDGDLAYVDDDENAGEMPMIVAAAYTNPDNDPDTGTELYNADGAANRLVLQDPPNDGGLQTIGSLNLPENSTVRSFDIGSDPPDALLVAVPGMEDMPALYRVDLDTGATTLIDTLGADVVALAIRIDAAPAPSDPTPTEAAPDATPTMTPPAATPSAPTPMPPSTGTGSTLPGSGTPVTAMAVLVLLMTAGALSLTIGMRNRTR